LSFEWQGTSTLISSHPTANSITDSKTQMIWRCCSFKRCTSKFFVNCSLQWIERFLWNVLLLVILWLAPSMRRYRPLQYPPPNNSRRKTLHFRTLTRKKRQVHLPLCFFSKSSVILFCQILNCCWVTASQMNSIHHRTFVNIHHKRTIQQHKLHLVHT
jgi:hypothetical protein